MDVNVMIGKEAFLDAERPRIRSHPGERGLHGFLHDLANLPGHSESALAFHDVGFNEQNIAAGRSPRQADYHSGALSPLRDFAFAAHFDSTQELLNDFRRDDQLLRFSFGQPTRLFAAKRADVALEFTYAGFRGVVADRLSHRLL